MEILIITGESGSGKTWAYEYFEDSGYYCIDNLPPALIMSFVELMQKGKKSVKHAAFVIDVRSGDFISDLQAAVADLRGEGIDVRILYLQASENELLTRFAQTRRLHPLAQSSTNEVAISYEKDQLRPIKQMADVVIDTTDFKSSAQFFEALSHSLGADISSNDFKIIISSFGFKNGLPKEVDMMHDMRFIPNPFYIDELKSKNGSDKAVYDFVMDKEISQWFKDHVLAIISKLIPAYIKENKPSLNIAFGCTGGQHRSVAMAISVYKELSKTYDNIILIHRDIPSGQ